MLLAVVNVHVIDSLWPTLDIPAAVGIGGSLPVPTSAGDPLAAPLSMRKRPRPSWPPGRRRRNVSSAASSLC
jgi:hypothetical protein